VDVSAKTLAKLIDEYNDAEITRAGFSDWASAARDTLLHEPGGNKDGAQAHDRP
jgi:hypothetical protein